MRIPHRLAVVVAVVALLPACDKLNPFSPSAPQVAGTYTGSITILVAGRTLHGTARINVRQSGTELTVEGSVSFAGIRVPITAVTGTINETGFFTPAARSFVGAIRDPVCGQLTPVSASLTFSGNTARYVENISSQLCGGWTISATLNKSG